MLETTIIDTFILVTTTTTTTTAATTTATSDIKGGDSLALAGGIAALVFVVAVLMMVAVMMYRKRKRDSFPPTDMGTAPSQPALAPDGSQTTAGEETPDQSKGRTDVSRTAVSTASLESSSHTGSAVSEL